MEDENRRKWILLIIIALLIAFMAYFVAQNAQTSSDNNANITNVFEIVVNNTNLGCYHPAIQQTCERKSGVVYVASSYPLEFLLKAHVEQNNAHFKVNISINGTEVQYIDTTTIQADQNFSMAVLIPRGANYLYVNTTSIHHVEVYEYPILSGRNGTLSVNQTFVTTGTSFNSTYVSEISALQSNDTYFNGTVYPQSTNFRNDTVTTNSNSIKALQANDSYFNGTVYPQSTNFRNDSITTNTNSIISLQNNDTYFQSAPVRAMNTIYHNTGTNTRWVLVTFNNAANQYNVIAYENSHTDPGATEIGVCGATTGLRCNIFFPVTSGNYYKVNNASANTVIYDWTEWS